MANFLENFGLGHLYEDDDTMNGLLLITARDGKCLKGYYDIPSLWYKFGDFEPVIRTSPKEDGEGYEITGFDTHCTGNTVWDVCISEGDVDYDDPMRKRILVKSKEDGSGVCAVDVMHPDILPSYMPGEEIKMQVVAFPIQIDYLATEEEYDKLCPKNKFGNSFGLAEGSIFPLGLFTNSAPDKKPEEIEDEVWSHVIIRGRVKFFRECYVQFGESRWPIVRTVIDTHFGELELIHTYEQVKEEQRDNLKKDAIVTGIFEISGDPAIYEYKDGIVKDEENSLRALRQALCLGHAERLQTILKADAVYTAGDGTEYRGCDEIIQRLNYVHEHLKEDDTDVHARFAVLEEQKTDDSLPYQSGKRCMVLSYGKAQDAEAIVFIEMENGEITKIILSSDSRYVFRIDKPLGEIHLLDEIKIPESFAEPMLSRAIYHQLIAFDERETILSEGEENNYIRNAERMYEDISRTGFVPEIYEYMFGYLFAKAVEKRISQSRHIGFYPEDIYEKRFTSDLTEEWDDKIQIAIDLGKQFYKDFCFFHPVDSEEDETYKEDMVKALVLTQKLGERFQIERL